MSKLPQSVWNQLVQGLEYVCDAALDTALLLSRVSAIVLRRLIWLKCWQTRHLRKPWRNYLSRVGGYLAPLWATLLRTSLGGKSTSLPQSRKGKEPRRKQGPSFSTHKRLFHQPGSAGKRSQSNKGKGVLGITSQTSPQTSPLPHEGLPPPDLRVGGSPSGVCGPVDLSSFLTSGSANWFWQVTR